MTRKTFESRVFDYADNSNLDSDYLLKLLEPCYEALEWVRQVNKKPKTTPKAFRKHIQYTLNNLLELQNFISDEGNKKLARRCEKLLKDLDKYENKKLLIHSKMDNYFKVIFREKVPIERDIINLASIDIENKLLMQSNFDLEYLSYLIEEIFEIKPTSHEPYYHKIIMIKNKKPIILGEYRFNNHIPYSMRMGKEKIRIFEFKL